MVAGSRSGAWQSEPEAAHSNARALNVSGVLGRSKRHTTDALRLDGFFKPDATSIDGSLQQLATDFLSQPSIEIRAAGPLRDKSGKRAGMMMIFEDENRQSAQSFINDSPFLRAGIYEDHRLYEYSNEVG